MSVLNRIRQEISRFKDDELSSEGSMHEISIPEAIIASKKSSRDTQETRTYENLMYKQKMLAFRKTHDVSVFDQTEPPPPLDNLNDFTHNFIEDLDETVFKKSWGRLNKEHKINRILHFVQRVTQERQLNDEQMKYIRRLLITSLRNRQITTKDSVEYDVEKGELVNIKKLVWVNDVPTFENPSGVGASRSDFDTKPVATPQNEIPVTRTVVKHPLIIKKLAPTKT